MSNEDAGRVQAMIEPAFSSNRTHQLIGILTTQAFAEANTPARAGVSPKLGNKVRDTILNL
jgi:hypothetical protein